MVSRVEKIIYNPYFCYSPIVFFTLFFSSVLIKLSPTKCLFNSIEELCLFYKHNAYLIYHPLNIINLLFLLYNILYLYYNVILKKDIVGKSVKKIYHQTTKNYYIRRNRKRLSILLFCYVSALLISYARFSITLFKIIDFK